MDQFRSKKSHVICDGGQK